MQSAFLDGVPGFVSDADLSDDEPKKPKTKKLKQLRHEAQLKLRHEAQLKLRQEQERLAPPLRTRDSLTVRHAPDGREYARAFMRAPAPHRGDQRVIVHKVLSARELYLYQESHVSFFTCLPTTCIERVQYT